MAASAFYQDTALQHSARVTVEPVYLSETVAPALCLQVQYPGRLQS